MTPSLPSPFDVSHYVAGRVFEIRSARRWTRREVVQKCALRGYAWLTADTYRNIENAPRDHRNRRVTVDDLVALASVFGVAPAELLPRLPGAEEAELTLLGIQQLVEDVLAKFGAIGEEEETDDRL